MRFEWDAAKDLANRKKHGIDFRTAARVFDDAHLVLMEDRVDETGEQRWLGLGMIEGQYIVIVVHVYREAEDGEEIVRIISARKANQREGRLYLQ